MRKFIIFLIVLIMSITVIYAEMIKNLDKPLFGNWNLEQTKVWEISETGKDAFARIGQILIDEDGNLYVHDTKIKKFFVFNKDGLFKKTFGNKGEAPGEIKQHLDSKLYIVEDKLIAKDIDRINYFTKKGKFVNSIRNSFKRNPVIFLDSDEFIFFPFFINTPKDGMGKISRFNLKTGKEFSITRFNLYQGGRHKDESMDITMTEFGVTPTMTTFYDKNSKTLYYGKNDTYTINRVDMNGKKLNSFSLKRKQIKLPEEYKKNLINKSPKSMPKNVVKKLVGSLPDYETYFVHIDIYDELVYIHVPDFNNENRKQIDIFSPEGKYLYKTFVKVPDNSSIKIIENQHYLFKKGYLYMVVEDNDGEIKIIKYKVKLPTYKNRDKK